MIFKPQLFLRQIQLQMLQKISQRKTNGWLLNSHLHISTPWQKTMILSVNHQRYEELGSLQTTITLLFL